MPIPFRDQDDVEELGVAAYLRLEADADRPGYRGALFQINARGEPVEFTYNRVGTPSSFLWRPGDLRRSALKKLTASLLATCSRAPRLILGLAAQTPSELFSQDIRVAVPVARLAIAAERTGFSTLETHETLETDAEGEEAPVHLLWFPTPPAANSPERRLLQELHRRGLLHEPFERAGVGLHEVYGEPDDPAARP
jgi:hypothetical protein